MNADENIIKLDNKLKDGKGKRIRKTKASYEDNVKPYLDKIKNWRMLGATIEEIAESLNISESALYSFQKRYNEFKEALHAGTKELVIQVKASLLKQALGYRERDVRTIVKHDVIVQQEVFDKYFPPNERAAAMILRNYDKDYIEKGKDINMQNLTEELAKTGLIKITDDISEALRKANEENEDISSKPNEDN